jgi:WD40 repeat protein
MLAMMREYPANYEYHVGGSLPVDASSYVMRQADSDFYALLKAGQFCYVLNSRQMGKSSLRVRTMQRLQAEGFLCAFIDLTGIGKEEVTAEKWYAGLVQSLVSSCQLSKKFKWRTWWKEQREILSPVQRLSLFIEEVLLEEIEQKIVIFVDEIDRVLSQSFSVDDFFALIRFFYNRRVDEPKYQRLTFALLGVATPSDLIADKTQTPFNIGSAIALQGFQLHEVQSLTDGLTGKVSNPQDAIAQILDWTGGQPFLTQKLCKLMVEESALGNSPSVEQVVKSRILENWESQDEPEHLRTIRDRLLRNEQKAGQLLGLYQQILTPPSPRTQGGGNLKPPFLRGDGGISADGSPEQTELRLSGLVVQQQGKLKVYNRIYQQVFNKTWVEKQLEKLRPYSQIFKAWVASDFQDESRLLRGQALQDALVWANNQSLSTLDYRFLAASQDLAKREFELSLAVKEEEGRILAKANNTLTQAQQKAQKIIIIGSAILSVSLVAAVVTGLQLRKTAREQAEANVSFKSAATEITLVETPLDGLIKALKVGKKLQDLKKSAPVGLETQKQVESTLREAISLVRERNRLEGHESHVTTVSISPNGQLIASGDESNIVKLWDVKGNLITTFKGHSDRVLRVSFSPDSKTLASGGYDGTIKLWNVEDRTHKKTILAHNNTWVRGVTFSPDGKLLASSDSLGLVKLWKVEDGTVKDDTPLKTISAHPSRWVTYVKFSPDSKILASASVDGTVKLWKVEDGSLLKTLKGDEHIRGVDFSPDGKNLASTSVGSVKVWNIEDGSELYTLQGHRGTVWSVSFSPDGKLLASSGEDGTLKVWNLGNRETEPQTLKGHVGRIETVTFNRDGKMLVSVGSDRTIRLWFLEGIEPRTLIGHSGKVLAVDFSPDGKTLASADTDDTIQLWNVRDRRLQKTIKGHKGDDWRVSFSPNGKFLASGSADGTVKLWNVQDGTEVYTRKGHTNSVQSVSFSSDGKLLASGSQDRTVKLWRVEDGELLQTLNRHHKMIQAVSFSPDSKSLASASNDGLVILWDVESGKISKVFDARTVYLASVSFSPDGKFIAFGGGDRIVRLWNVKDGTEFQTLKGHGEWIRSIKFSPDGKLLASGSFDHTVKLWRVEDGKLLQTLESHLDWVENVSFSPDGKTIASASYDGTVKLWNLALDVDDLMGLGCEWLRDYLTTHPEEAKNFSQVCK